MMTGSGTELEVVFSGDEWCIWNNWDTLQMRELRACSEQYRDGDSKMTWCKWVTYLHRNFPFTDIAGLFLLRRNMTLRQLIPNSIRLLRYIHISFFVRCSHACSHSVLSKVTFLPSTWSNAPCCSSFQCYIFCRKRRSRWQSKRSTNSS